MFNFFEKAVPPFPESRIEQPPTQLSQFIWYYAKPFRYLLLVLFITSAIIAGIEVYMFSAIGEMIDWMQTGDPTTFISTHGSALLKMMLLVVIVWPVLNLIDSAVEHQGLLGNFAMQVRWRAHRYLLRQSTSFFANDFSGRIATKVMQTALSVRDSIVSINGLMVYVIVYFTSSAVIFLSNDWRLASPLICWLCAYVLVMRYFLPRLKEISAQQSDARSTMTGRVVDAYTNIQTVKMFSTNNAEEEYAKDSMQEMLTSVYQQMRLVTTLNATLITINAFLICGTLGLGIWLWTQSIVSAGAIAVSGALTLRLQAMSQWFIWELARLFEAIGTTQDGINTISQPSDVTDPAEPIPLKIEKASIDFESVSFHYGKKGGVIDDFSLSIKPGERIGLVGQSGAGKSTLVSLLLRLYDIESGSIRIDGQDITSITQESLRQNIATVTQDTSLLHRTIRENIAYGKHGATEQEILAAASLAKADGFIHSLEDNEGNIGLDAKVGERGVKLSGGQRQRIAIARVILKNAPILILDEATSALDSEVEAAIQEQLEGLMHKKTVVAIAHRLSTIAKMDRLIVLEGGKIAEIGTHQKLLDQNGIYAKYWTRQSGGFISEA
ncbi:ABC transporter ATP-binding protein [Arenicella sp. 4NH20-0111]|uniref:ABC transporter ATP-binding protein n=1 Tax=Arenicella sp. 4NH20-0111 TaxID=3127648 RepID=UPI003103A2C4